ncbi:MAG: DUF2804 domain-containing protein [Anaerolineae bacterium]
MQQEIAFPAPLLAPDGRLTTAGWARHPLLDCNLEDARFYPAPLRPLQFLRIKRWDYYAVFTPRRFFSATIADLGYAANLFVYTLDFETNELYEESLIAPLGGGVILPRNSTEGDAYFNDGRVRILLRATPDARALFVDWPAFKQAGGIRADITLACPPRHESMNIVIPIGPRRFYFNRKVNCMPARGYIHFGDIREELNPRESIGSLDWGRGVWDYKSFWNWASASGFLPDGRTIGLNLGTGFGDTSAATENAVILDGRIHKLEQVPFVYDPKDYMHPWRFKDAAGRLDLEFVPFRERLARTNLLLIQSEVHQMFGRYSGRIVTEEGEVIRLDGLTGFAEEHHARW